jgi:transcriptional regulator with XRE-family HTH domain
VPPRTAPRKQAAPPSLPSSTPADPSPAQLGRRIKLLRVSRDLTLKELEARGGISATHISEIERGKASPTLGVLARIARALGERPATLIEPRVLPEVTVARPGERTGRRVQMGRATLEPIAEPVHGAQVGAYLITLPIGRDAGLTHRHEGEEWVMVLSGVAEIRIEEVTHVLREGDGLHFRAEREHAYLNASSGPTVLLAASRPRLAI